MSFFKSLAIQKNWQTSLEVLESMRSKRILPDIWVYNMVLHCCARAEVPEIARDIWNELTSTLHPDVVSYNSYMAALEKGGQPARALAVFDTMPASDTISVNIAIGACGKLGQWERAMGLFARLEDATPASYTTVLGAMRRWQEALRLYASFPESARRSAEIHNAALRSLAREAQFDQAIHLLEELPSTRGYNTALRGATWEQALDVLTVHMPRARCLPNVQSYSSALRALRNGKQWERALAMLGDLTQRSASSMAPSVVAYNEVLHALEQANKPARTRRLLRHMEDGRCAPNVVSYQCAIVASGRQKDGWRAAVGLFEDMTRRECAPDPLVYTSLVRILGEGGQWMRALDTLAAAPAPTTPMVNACISALRHGQSQKDALRLLEAATPDVITYTAAIAACTEWTTALRLFNAMRPAGISPTIQTASAIVRALARDQPSIALRIFAKIAPRDRDVTLLNTALLALESLGAWPAVLQLVQDSPCDAVTYRTAIDICERHAQFAAAEDLFKRMTTFGFQTPLCGPKLELHGYTQGMACAAVRAYLRVQPIRDLIIVIGEGKHSEERPVLEGALRNMGERMRPAVQFESGSFALSQHQVVQTGPPIRGRLKLSEAVWAQWREGGQQMA